MNHIHNKMKKLSLLKELQSVQQKNEIVLKQKQLETYFAIVQPRAIPTSAPTHSGVSGWGCYPL